ncbi:RNA-directed DNA polymerase, eukaryota, reverse transcriptase zinc-binding domain protein [Tanacetum coccineum]|uniref:RNA-directed DNA polymerase, eukaryota, reverse transcriptase zinc-binding domain protein n=1 Tax=Tanacetum coccineum TaxID=301880 RepID=A0ABQ5IGP7_9ASTR
MMDELGGVSSTSFSISINGTLHGYFKGERGLRQGDPMSPYLFTLVMEVLTLMLRRRVRNSDTFTYHPNCSHLNIINLCFADDLFLFAHGDVNSARVIMEALDEFKNTLGLVPSLPKSTAYFSNVLNYIKLDILNVLSFEEGKFPVKYLGVPLVSSRLIYRGCKELVEKVKRDMRKGGAKVAWESVCLPKTEGGLGLRKLNVFNKALISIHIWSILSLKESIWVKWIHVYKLRGHNFWDLPLSGNVSWGWRKILQVRPLIRQFIWYHLGEGNTVSAWFDWWCLLSPLSHLVTPRDIHRAGFNMASTVYDIVTNGSWKWPNEWRLKYPSLYTITFPSLVPNSLDEIVWKTRNDMDSGFSVWQQVQSFTGVPNMPSSLDMIVNLLSPEARERSARSIIVKLVFAASCYFIWQERNNRLFKNQKRSEDQLIEVIKSTVRLKLLSCKFKKTTNIEFFLHLWKLPSDPMARGNVYDFGYVLRVECQIKGDVLRKFG